tara:strand:+ start:239 stop:688 length:450 start_codon:yes stop_codon:yes gene_type:complete
MAKGTLNKVLLIGRLGSDPEIRTSPGGIAVANFSIATNESWKNKDGEQQERTDWHRCVVFGITVEKFIGPYVKKGTLVSVEGQLQTTEWKDKEKNERLSTKVVVNPFGGIQILGSVAGRENYDSSAGMDQTPKISEENTSQVTEDDLPF